MELKISLSYTGFNQYMAGQSKQEAKKDTEDKKIVPEKELFSWKAPARPFKQRDREFWVTVIAIAAVTGLVLFLIEGVMPVLLIIALVFLFYVLTTVPPEKITYTITNKGLKIADKKTEWNAIVRFWFTKRFNNKLLVLDLNSIPGRLEVVVNKKDIKEIREQMSKYIMEEKSSPSYTDRAANWFARKLPGNK